MTLPIEPEHISDLRQRCHAGEESFRLDHHTVCVFSATDSKTISKDNYADLTLPDRLIDLLLKRPSSKVSWLEVRSAWLSVLRDRSAPESLAIFYNDMESHLHKALGQESDFVWLIQRMITQSLMSALIVDLTTAEQHRLFKNIDNKLTFLLDVEAKPQTIFDKWRSMQRSLQAASVFRRRFKKCGKTTSSSPDDLLSALFSLLPRLGVDRAVDAMVTMMTAVSGPPGAAATCLAFELTRHPHWRQQIQDELLNLPLAQFLAAPLKTAPTLTAFIKEVLRMWNVPMVVRKARKDMSFTDLEIAKDNLIVMSPYLVHRNPKHWPNPNEFNPNRWLQQDEREEQANGAYVPFGWAPKNCVGSQLGILQLALLAHLLCTKYKLELDAPEKLNITMAAFPQPINFIGKVTLENISGA